MRCELEETARKLYTYLAFKGLCINFGKCHLMVLGKPYLDTAQPAQIGIFHQGVVEEPELKLLGLVIDNKLSFETYVLQLAAKCNNNTKFLWRTAKDRSDHHRHLLANALVVSHLNYCDTVYHRFLSEKLSGILNSVQYRVLRFICGVRSGQRVSTRTLCDQVGWIPLHNHRECKLLTLIWRTTMSLVICRTVYTRIVPITRALHPGPPRSTTKLETQH